MKIQQIQLIETRNNSVQKPQAQPVFRGAANGLIAFWDAMGRGGWTANFLLQDVGGNNIPRTTISLNRNKEELGHLNYIAGAETFIRESLSGPSMVAVPLGIMGLSTGLAGQAVKVPTKNIADFSDIMKGTLKGLGEGADVGKEALRRTFYTDVLDALGVHSLGGNKKFTTEALEKIGIIEGGTLTKRNFIQRLFKKNSAGSLDEAVSSLHTNYSKLRQGAVEYGEDFLSGKIAKSGKETDFADLISQMRGYFDDFSKKALPKAEGGRIKLPKGLDSITDKFKNTRMGQRFVTGIAMSGLMMLVLALIPKIYTLSKTSPELSKDSVEAKEGKGGGK